MAPPQKKLKVSDHARHGTTVLVYSHSSLNASFRHHAFDPGTGAGSTKAFVFDPNGPGNAYRGGLAPDFRSLDGRGKFKRASCRRVIVDNPSNGQDKKGS